LSDNDVIALPEPRDPPLPAPPLTIEEVASVTGVDVATLRYYRNNGAGPRSYLLARVIVYDLADVEKWLEDRKRATGKGGTEAAR
jgi:predicted DNA-binding transcriptional regulator AlpA